MSTGNLFLGGNTARTFQLLRHTTANTAGSNLTITAGGATSAATDKSGGDLLLQPGQSTGTARELVRIQGYTSAANSGTSDNALIDRFVVNAYKALTNNTTTSVVNLTLASNTSAGVIIKYGIEVFNGSDVQNETGQVTCVVSNKAGTVANNICQKYGNINIPTAGTLDVTWSLTAASPSVVQLS